MKHHHIRRLCLIEGPGSSAQRAALTPTERKKVLEKTAGACHVCGGRAGRSWQADHVTPHRLGGKHSLKNYLPVCRTCNTLRRSHSPKVQQLIIRLGTYGRNEIRQGTPVGEQLLRILLGRQNVNRARRKASS